MDEAAPAGERPNPFWLLLDVAAIVAFVVVGRDTHQESNSLTDVIRTAAPFLLALVVGWFVTRAKYDPLSWATGLGVFAVVFVGGMLARRFLYDDGTAAAFVIVSGVFFAITLLGWRAGVRLVERRRASAKTTTRAD